MAARKKKPIESNNKTALLQPMVAESAYVRIRTVICTMLTRLELELQKDAETAPDEMAKKREELFGPKHSLVGALVLLVELIIKLDEAESKIAQESMDFSQGNESALTPADIALAAEFIRKSQHQ
jgi:hypothetical protein